MKKCNWDHQENHNEDDSYRQLLVCFFRSFVKFAYWLRSAQEENRCMNLGEKEYRILGGFSRCSKLQIIDIYEKKIMLSYHDIRNNL